MRAAVVRIVRCQQQHMLLQPASNTGPLLRGKNRFCCPNVAHLHVTLKPGCLTALMSSSGSTSSSRTHSRNAGSKSNQLSAKASDADGSVDDEETDEIRPGKPLRVERLLANLGYGKRKECTVMIKRKQLVYADTGQPAKVGEKALASQLLLGGEPLDPAPPLTLILHKPTGYVVTSPEDEVVLDPKVYDLLPYRFGRRRPFLSSVGRLDKDTSGLLLMTDDGQLLHSIQSPAKGIWKRYQATLAAPLTGKEADKAIQLFASGRMQLQGDRTPLLPAALHMLDDASAEISICEGRYHQIRRMFAALGHTVVELHRHTIGGLSLLDEPHLALGSWRLATQADINAVMAGPDSLAAVQQQGGGCLQEHQGGKQQLQQQVVLPSPPKNLQDRPTGSSISSTASLQEAASSSPSNSRAEEELGLHVMDDVDHPGENAAAARRFKNSMKRARQKAVLSRGVKALRAQQQQQQQQQQRSEA